MLALPSGKACVRPWGRGSGCGRWARWARLYAASSLGRGLARPPIPLRGWVGGVSIARDALAPALRSRGDDGSPTGPTFRTPTPGALESAGEVLVT